jgi:mannose-6-phosphate isomerase-like protein (cupin superfamily)
MPNYSAKEGPFKVALAAGDAIWFIGGYITLLSHARETRGQISLTEWVGPRGMCAPPHSHTLEAEGFYILEGDLTVGVGGQKFECQRGDFVYVPFPSTKANWRGSGPTRQLGQLYNISRA